MGVVDLLSGLVRETVARPEGTRFNVLVAKVVEVIESPESGPLFDSVLRLSKLAKATVGFMPDSGFRDRAEKGTLLVARQNDVVVGYLLYDLPRDEVRIRQLVTKPEMRGQGIARSLIDELVGRHPSRRGVVLECRRDYEVNKVWPKLHFTPVEERRGRSRAGLPLTVWVRDFGHPTLFSVVADNDTRPVAALDANIVIDVANEVTSTLEVLQASWLQNSVRFAVTDQVLVEIDRQEDSHLRARNRRTAQSFDRLHVDAKVSELLLDHLKSVVPNPSKFDQDLRHAAFAASCGARWLITRDADFQRACADVVKAVTDVAIVTPGQFLVDVDADIRDDTYRPADLAGSSLEFRALSAHEFEAAARAFVNEREGERLSWLRDNLERCAARAPEGRLRVLADGESLLGVLASSGEHVMQLDLCRVSRGGAQSTIARQLLGIARAEAAQTSAAAVRLTDPHCGEWVRRAATKESYLPSGAGFTAIPIAGVGDRSELIVRVDAALGALPAEAIPPELAPISRTQSATVLAEKIFHPWRLTRTDLPSFVISIEPFWAGELFDVDIVRGSLFPRQTGLALQREHVYYRSPLASGGLTAPARILWYVKQGPTNTRGIRAISSLDELATGESRRLYRRFAHLGIYSERQVEEASDGRRVMALRFSHSAMLRSPISLEDYRAVMRAEKLGLTLQGPQRLPEQVFDVLATMSV